LQVPTWFESARSAAEGSGFTGDDSQGFGGDRTAVKAIAKRLHKLLYDNEQASASFCCCVMSDDAV
jgi:hypothetical protein